MTVTAALASDPAAASRPALTLLQGGAAATVVSLADRQAIARDRIAAGTLTLISRQWTPVTDPRDPEVVEAVSRAVLRLVQGGQAATANSTAAYLRGVLGQLSSRHVAYVAGGIVLAASLRGLQDPAQAYWRAFEQWRYQRSLGVPDDVAKTRGLRRLLLMADQDLSMSMRTAAQQVFEGAEDVIGYRRLVRPEQSRGGPCGLCLAASDRVYRTGDLLPLHGRCCCDVMPKTRKHDPGQELNAADLGQLYETAGSTTGPDLKAVRVTVHHHGELGPQLRAA